MPIAVRRYKPPKPGARVYRFPSPGSEPANLEYNEIGYKTAYRDSIHNIRYNVDIHPLLEEWSFISDPLGETATEKLVRYGVLKQSDMKNQEAIDAAKKVYLEKWGESVDVKLHQDDFGIAESLVIKGNTESVSEFVAGLFESTKQTNANEAWMNDLDEVYRAQFYQLKWFDMLEDDPVYRQLTLDIEGQLLDIMNDRLERKNIPVFKSNPAYWRILDDSFSEENAKKVQASVKNFAGTTDYAPVKVGEGEIPPQRPVPTIPVPHKSQYVE